MTAWIGPRWVGGRRSLTSQQSATSAASRGRGCTETAPSACGRHTGIAWSRPPWQHPPGLDQAGCAQVRAIVYRHSGPRPRGPGCGTA
eukprot:9268286-Prorocentrum_lima.AAC.1